jgi:hypothetical protein
MRTEQHRRGPLVGFTDGHGFYRRERSKRRGRKRATEKLAEKFVAGRWRKSVCPAAPMESLPPLFWPLFYFPVTNFPVNNSLFVFLALFAVNQSDFAKP